MMRLVIKYRGSHIDSLAHLKATEEIPHLHLGAGPRFQSSHSGQGQKWGLRMQSRCLSQRCVVLTWRRGELPRMACHGLTLLTGPECSILFFHSSTASHGGALGSTEERQGQIVRP